MKRMLSLLMALCCLCACAAAENAPREYPQFGLKMTLPENAEALGLSVISNHELLNLVYQSGNERTALVVMERVDESLFPQAMADAQVAAIMEESRMQHLGTENGTDYMLFSITAFENPADYFQQVLNADFAAFSPQMQEGIHSALPHVEKIVESMQLMPVEKPAIALSAFTTVDLDGNEVTEAIFAEKELTVVNVWGTFCGPCINEMPELALWEKELPENVQIIGIISDVNVGGDTTMARAIVEKTGITFQNLLVSEDLYSFLSLSQYVPTTYFLDSHGVSVGDPVVGANVAQYKQFVEDYLQ